MSRLPEALRGRSSTNTTRLGTLNNEPLMHMGDQLLGSGRGGLLGPLRDFFTGRDDWFALYAADGRIDDETFCDAVKRGNFRLHPKGRLGRSEGCVVIDRAADYVHLRTLLKSVRPQTVPGASLQAYGSLVVT
ncbi:tlde1 domain-containing protein [Denitromonas iodatirespirans]|uniref:DUF2778 domain-containing protein n=1 Tax=Denitromonas iodatirespirans TaxID=2795389 RepID=A0A944DAA4_DENI1|nr:tlde1 domain-containing protein [Denitromonas iodatirespirans]MBT0962864.1 DUF2778 domain-containing protein [Denitromonas iodatirespirans]